MPSGSGSGATGRGRPAIDLTGRKFGRLTVLRRGGNIGAAAAWECECECGNRKITIGASLRLGVTQSCGCLRTEIITKHGKRSSPEYRAWKNLKSRCFNPRRREYHRYGERGITVCDRWLHSFENFYADMGPRPTPRHSLDRFPNNDGNYEPGNCRWATHREQCNNIGRNHLITHAGRTMSLSDWAREVSLSPKMLSRRIAMGWATEDALMRPARKCAPRGSKKEKSECH